MALRDMVLDVAGVEIEYDGCVLGGDELWSAVDARARELGAADLHAGDRVLLDVELTHDYIVLLLATLSAGLVPVPLDVSTPAVVVEEIAARSGAAARVTAAGVSREATSPTNRSGPEDLQYILFTSGSTGRPKGVLGSGQGLANRIRWGREQLFAGGHRRCAVRTSPAFVDSLTEILGAVAAGKRLVVVPPTARRDVELLARFVSEHRVEQVTATPSIVPLLTAIGDRWPLAGVRRWIFSGEELRADWVEQIRALSPRAEVINSYGSTEVSGDVAFYRITSDAEIPRPVPIGTVVPGVAWRVDFERGGVGVGELLVGGCQVALGYLDEGVTSGAFVDRDVVPGTAVGRWFRTNDLVSATTDGLLRLHGRRDQVVKVRGRRVDLGGVACALEVLPEVVEAAAWLERSASGATALLAAVAPHTGRPVEASGVLARMRTTVPEHLVPDRLVIVPHLPRTVSGKVDRSRLRQALPSATRPRQEHFATGIEYAVALGIADVLGHGDFGARTALSDVGLDSLRSVEAAEVIHRLLGCRIDGLQLRTINRVEGIAREVLRGGHERPTGPVRVVRDAPGPFVTVFLPPAIGTGLGYFPLLEQMPDHVTLALLEQDAGSTTVLESSGMEGLAGYYADAVVAAFRGKAIHVVGYSFGGVLAPAVWCALEARDIEVTGMVLLDPAIPYRFDDLPEDWALRRILGDAGYAEHLPPGPLTAARALDVVRRVPGPLEAVDASWIEQAARTLAANNARLVGHLPQRWSGRTLVVTAGDRERVVGEVAWVRECNPMATFEEVDCSHFELLRDPHVTRVARLVADCLPPTDER